MNKYSSLESDVYSVFDSNAWKLELIKTVPNNVIQTGAGNEFVRVSIIAGKQQDANILHSVSGLLIAEIFIEGGKGGARANTIADTLDKHLAGKNISATSNGRTQFTTSNLIPIGIDPVNAGLYRYKYTLPFNYFGA
jgi:hypothetical protein